MVFYDYKAPLHRKSKAKHFVAFVGVVLTLLLIISGPASATADVGQQEISLPALTEVTCASYLVYDRTTQKILVSQNPDQKIYPASMTKIMTALLALDHLTPDQTLTASETAIGATTPQSSLMGLEVGEQTTVNELLFGLMLPSGNDAANVLAEAIVTATNYSDPANPNRTTLDLFSDVMNNKVAELGLKNTHFINPSGLHDENHYTTANDLAKIFDYALQKDGLKKVVSSPTHVYKATSIHTSDAWGATKNSNLLLSDPWLLGANTKVAQVVGGKTGTTIPGGAGMALSALCQNGDELIAVVCGIPYEKADRLAVYVATVLNAGAEASFAADPVVRVQGSVMDNRQYNAPAGQEPATLLDSNNPPPATEPGTTASSLVEPDATSATGTVGMVEPTETTVAAVPIGDTNNTKGNPLTNFIQTNLIISIILALIIVVVILLVILSLTARHNRNKRKYKGIRRM